MSNKEEGDTKLKEELHNIEEVIIDEVEDTVAQHTCIESLRKF